MVSINAGGGESRTSAADRCRRRPTIPRCNGLLDPEEARLRLSASAHLPDVVEDIPATTTPSNRTRHHLQRRDSAPTPPERISHERKKYVGLGDCFGIADRRGWYSRIRAG